ncbi:hypothetical protein F3J27_00905 [Enterobacter sp. Ap-916]|uniref:hypothetical protein n=1 Tax=unclassified Enterobacter TaxID=2608935 RepID=UPI001421B188|nr:MULTISPECIES: hypothetical protein [unclassified Enterobacter]NIF58016.1 hypothetical protein [Enterobacter sp. Ap-867]NIG28042.1 hypothetical protein [Enterobacter sp. Ap-916]
MKLSLKKSVITVIAVCSLTACATIDKSKMYAGSDASAIYLYDDNTHQNALVTYIRNDKDKCYEKVNDEQLTILRWFWKSETLGMNKFTLKPGKTYALRSVRADISGTTYIQSVAFIPEANKSYYLRYDRVLEIPNNADAEYLNKLYTKRPGEEISLPQAKGWPIKNNTCSNFLTGSL